MGRNILSFSEFNELPEEEKEVLMGDVENKSLSAGMEDEFGGDFGGEETSSDFEFTSDTDMPSGDEWDSGEWGSEEGSGTEGSEEGWGDDTSDFEGGTEENTEMENLDGGEEEFSFETEVEGETETESESESEEEGSETESEEEEEEEEEEETEE